MFFGRRAVRRTNYGFNSIILLLWQQFFSLLLSLSLFLCYARRFCLKFYMHVNTFIHIYICIHRAVMLLSHCSCKNCTVSHTTAILLNSEVLTLSPFLSLFFTHFGPFLLSIRIACRCDEYNGRTTFKFNIDFILF